MERIYRGLMWVAGVALTAGLIQSVWLMSNHGQLYNGGWQSDSANSAVFGWLNVNMLVNLAPAILLNFIADLLFGATLLAIVVAWADHRWQWLVALVVTLAAAFCSVYAFAVVAQSPSFALVHPRVAAFIQVNATLIEYLLDILPCALAVVMTWRSVKWTQLRKQARAAADAELEITRSRL